ncbi:hypothetical protein BHF71_00960 [Vulcanibacillus modesticaldus]|uniref:Uncharacterized protein n=1 Tax=Vulcanibacillus modesticaldus TaxID=337097 RepID=A0A1D2YVS4_9BACI|nr:hypothetical protein [Vulcanibacillus modesticaldus]OEF99777.1 hypothetical protein BHF71_00960 [Vulcanibacillus modesticaldus]
MNIETISIALGSSVLASLVTALYTIKVKDKEHIARYIVEERQNWRKDIREKSVKFIEAEPCNKEKIMYELQVRLNPHDKHDNEIIELMKNIIKKCADNNCKKNSENENIVEMEEKEFIYKISELLKEDWERAKLEVKTDVGNLYKVIHLSYVFLIYFVYYIFWGKEVIDSTINSVIIAILIYFGGLYLARFLMNKGSIVKPSSKKGLFRYIKEIATEHYTRG